MFRKNTSFLITLSVSFLLAGQAQASKYSTRFINGKYNNIKKKNWGKSGCPLARFSQANYETKKGTLNLTNLPNPRLISNTIFKQEVETLNNRNLSDMVWQWGQFLDHDIDLSRENHNEEMPIEVPMGDEIFDSNFSGNAILTFFRSVSRIGKKSKARIQVNSITSYIDASNVYGSDKDRAQILRQLNNKGLMKMSSKGGLPYNLFGLDNAGGADRKDLYLAGDIRANEQIGLVAMHTLFIREHNRKATEIYKANPKLSDEEIYQKTRTYIGALMQHITYDEFLPALLGKDSIKSYNGYQKNVNSSISNEFATVAYRFGHSAVSPEILKVNNEGDELESIKVMESFFKPDLISDYNSAGHFLHGLASKRMQEVDTQVIDGLRNFLFIDVPNQPMLDLVSLNIQRGRDHGIADINTIRKKFNLTPYSDFGEISSNENLVLKLNSLYSSVKEADAWVLVLSEDHKPGSSLGETATAILVDQFERLRNGDRFYYENKMAPSEITEVKSLSLSDIIKLNTQVSSLRENAFVLN